MPRLDGFLRHHAPRLTGVLNGVDSQPLLPAEPNASPPPPEPRQFLDRSWRVYTRDGALALRGGGRVGERRGWWVGHKWVSWEGEMGTKRKPEKLVAPPQPL